MLWTVLNFFMLIGALSWLVSKFGKPALAARSKGIADGLAAGEKAKAEAGRFAADVKARLANLENEVARLRDDAKTEREREAARIRRDAELEIARIKVQVEHEIESAGKQARLEVQRAAAKLAIELAETKVRARMSPDVQASLVQAFADDLPRSGGIHFSAQADGSVVREGNFSAQADGSVVREGN